jgi:outer membrane murein-binding lipoprotein Lpp
LKKSGWIISLLFALLLAGCGQSTASTEKEDKAAETAETEAETKEKSETDKNATSQEVLAAASEKSAELKNFAMDGTLKMIMTTEEGTMETNAEMQTKTNVEPLFMQQTMQMEAEGQTNTIEMYMDQADGLK